MTTAAPTAALADLASIRTFVLAGHALFTIVSRKTGERRTFKVQKKEPNEKYPRPGYFVRFLSGPNNENDYQYLGFLFEQADGSVRFLARRDAPATPTLRAFEWFVGQLNASSPTFLEQAEFWHAGRCGKCGRTLTDPESIATGLGPVCAGRVAGRDDDEGPTTARDQFGMNNPSGDDR